MKEVAELIRPLLDPLADAIADRIADRVLERLQHRQVDSDGMPSDENLMNVDAAAKYLGLARGTLYKLASAGRVPRVKLGGRLLFRKADLNQYVEENKRGHHRVVELAKLARTR